MAVGRKLSTVDAEDRAGHVAGTPELAAISAVGQGSDLFARERHRRAGMPSQFNNADACCLASRSDSPAAESVDLNDDTAPRRLLSHRPVLHATPPPCERRESVGAPCAGPGRQRAFHHPRPCCRLSSEQRAITEPRTPAARANTRAALRRRKTASSRDVASCRVLTAREAPDQYRAHATRTVAPAATIRATPTRPLDSVCARWLRSPAPLRSKRRRSSL